METSIDKQVKRQHLEKLRKEIEEQKRFILKLTRQKEQERRNNKLAYFRCHGNKQLAFIQNADKKRRAIFAGNRFGKTTIASVEDCSYLLGCRPFFPTNDPLHRLGIPREEVKGLVIAEDWDKVHELFTNPGMNGQGEGRIFEFLPKLNIKGFTKNQNGVIDSISVINNIYGEPRISTVHFDTVKSYKNNPRSHESSYWDFIHVDEPIPEDMWKAVSRGLIDHNGSAWFTLTPLSEPWIYHMFTENLDDPNYWSCQATMDDNPLLTEEAKQMFLSQLDPVELDCRRRGIPLAFGNLVLSTYDESTHLWEVSKKGVPHGWQDAYTPPRSYCCAYAIDTHPQTPTAVLFVAIAPTGDIFFYDELWIGGVRKDRMSEVAKEINIRKDKVRMVYELCEPAAWVEDPETGRCFADVFYDYGLEVQKASKQRTYAIQQSRILFAQQERKVWVMDHCTVLRKELKRWSFAKDNRPEDKDDHMCECLGRLVVHDNFFYHPETDYSAGPVTLRNNSLEYDLSLIAEGNQVLGLKDFYGLN